MSFATEAGPPIVGLKRSPQGLGRYVRERNIKRHSPRRIQQSRQSELARVTAVLRTARVAIFAGQVRVGNGAQRGHRLPKDVVGGNVQASGDFSDDGFPDVVLDGLELRRVGSEARFNMQDDAVTIIVGSEVGPNGGKAGHPDAVAAVLVVRN